MVKSHEKGFLWRHWGVMVLARRNRQRSQVTTAYTATESHLHPYLEVA